MQEEWLSTGTWQLIKEKLGTWSLISEQGH